MDNVIT